MGILTDFVVADPSEAERVGKSVNPASDFSGLDAKGLDQVKLGTLYAILTGTEYDPDFMADDASYLYTASEEGPWVQQVPCELTERLADLEGAALVAVAQQWAETEEFASPQFGGWPSEQVQNVLRDLVQLAQSAVAQRKSLLMWMSL